MKTYPVGSTVTVTIPFQDDNGDAVTPTALSYVVLDGDEDTVFGPNAIADLTGTSTTITIPNTVNAAAGPRTVELSIQTAGGLVYAEAIYGVTGLQQLVFLQNSFQNYAQAAYLANSFLNLDGWVAATKADQIAALREAFDRLTKINFIIPWPEVVDVQNLYAPNYSSEINPYMWALMTPTLFARYPVSFVAALRKAQVVEADDILGGDPIGDKIRSGLFSEKIGESSMMFRSGVRPLKLVASRRAFDCLKGYVNNRLVITRS